MKLLMKVSGIIVLLFLSACSNETQDWEDAQSINTISGYQAYLEQYADGNFRLEAENLIESLHFVNAETDDTVEAYEVFLAHNPVGEHASVAQRRIENILLEEAETINTITGYQDFLEIYTEGSSAEKARGLLEKIYPSFTTESALTIEGISAIVGDGRVVFSTGKEPGTLAIRVLNMKVPVEAGMTCLFCARTVEIAPNLEISTWYFEMAEHYNPTPYVVSNVSFEEMSTETPLKESQPPYIVSGPEGAILQKEASAFLLVSGQANLLRGNSSEEE